MMFVAEQLPTFSIKRFNLHNALNLKIPDRDRQQIPP